MYAGLSLAGALLLSNSVAQDKPSASTTKAASAKEAAPNMEEMTKQWEAIAAPGAAHKALEPLVGEWNVEARWWMAGPDAPPSESKGSTKVSWILGGRYVQEDYTSEMMGKPFQGVGITGYDNFKKKYVSFWIDNMGTGMLTSEGTADPEAKVMTFQGKMDDPMSGQKDKPMKFIIRILGPNKHTFEMHDLSLGDKSKMGEMTYTRK